MMNDRPFPPLQRQIIGSDSSIPFHIGQHHGPHDTSLWHYHPEIELIKFHRDGGVLFLGTEIHTFKSGELFLIGADVPHCWSSSAAIGSDAHTIYAQFLPTSLGSEFFKLPQVRAIASLLDLARRGLRFSSKLADRINPRLDVLLHRQRGDWRQLYEMLGILGDLAESQDFEMLSAHSLDEELDQAMDHRLRAILQFIDRNMEGALTRKAVSSHVRLAPEVFSRYFKQRFGKTFVQYLKELRIKKACHLLLNSDAPITEIAFISGFNNLSNFNRQFQAMMKVTPNKYRKMMPK